MIEKNFARATRITELIAAHKAATITDAECMELTVWLEEAIENQELFKALTGDNLLEEIAQRYHEYDAQQAFERIHALMIPVVGDVVADPVFNVPANAAEEIRANATGASLPMRTDSMSVNTPVATNTNTSHMIPHRRWKLAPVWWAAAMVLVIAVSITYLTRNNNLAPDAAVQLQKESHPAMAGARLTLSDGTVIDVDQAQNKVIATEGSQQVVIQNGALAYVSNPGENNQSSGQITYNTLATAKGRQFEVRLPDGSKAWLNAASAITYPTAFAHEQRLVSIEGEVYFEVLPDKNKPFIVRAANQLLQVTGTSFNINAYTDEAQIVTTLVTGGVKLKRFDTEEAAENAAKQPSSLEQAISLKPNQQAILKAGNEVVDQATTAAKQTAHFTITAVDAQVYTSWKEGVFNFHQVKLAVVLREIERWYDIKVVSKNSLPDILFWGKVGRDVKLKDMIAFLEKSGVKSTYNENSKTLTIQH